MSNLRYKVLSTLPVVGTGVILTSLPTTAMFRNTMSSTSRTIQTSSTSGASGSLTKPSTPSTQPRFFYGSNGVRIPVQPPAPSTPKI